MQIRYRLTGHESGWVAAGRQRFATYTNLQPGSHRFEIEAANADGVWSKAPVAVRIDKLPKWHERTDLRAASVLAAGFLLFLGYRGRTRHLRMLAQRLERQVRGRTRELVVANDEIGRTLRDLQQAQDQLVEASKQASLATLVVGIAHEINTPLGSALTVGSHIGKESAELGRKLESNAVRRSELDRFIKCTEEGVELLEHNLNTIASLVDRFKQIGAGPDAMPAQELELGDWLATLQPRLERMLAVRGHSLNVACPHALPLRASPLALLQVVEQLVENSILHAFTQGGGHVRIELGMHEGRPMLCYQDDGRGVSDEVSSNLFDPFTTTQRGSRHAGLGMHLIFNLVHRVLDGELELFDAKPGFGVRIVLPLVQPER